MQKTPGLTPRRLLHGLIKGLPKVSWGLELGADEKLQSFLGSERKRNNKIQLEIRCSNLQFFYKEISFFFLVWTT